MRKYLQAAMMIILISCTHANAQIPYAISVKNDTYQPLTAATSINNGKVWADENYVVPLGFDIKMGAKTISKFNFIGGEFIGTDTAGVISGFSITGSGLHDRGAGTATSRSALRYSVSGTAGSRIFKAEIANAGFSDEYDNYQTANDSVNIQVWVYEGSNAVEYRFGASKISHFTEYFPMGGPLLGFAKNTNPSTGDYETIYLLKGSVGAPTVDTFNIGRTDNGLTSFPPSGTVYRFIPKDKVTGIADNGLQNAIRVYPTQAINTLTVENAKSGMMNYRVVSLDGRELSNGTLPQGTGRINVSGYPAGAYMLFITGDGEASAHKFVKM